MWDILTAAWSASGLARTLFHLGNPVGVYRSIAGQGAKPIGACRVKLVHILCPTTMSFALQKRLALQERSEQLILILTAASLHTSGWRLTAQQERLAMHDFAASLRLYLARQKQFSTQTLHSQHSSTAFAQASCSLDCHAALQGVFMIGENACSSFWEKSCSSFCV